MEEEIKQEVEEKNPKKNFSIPMAIIVAGLIIAAAIAYRMGPKQAAVVESVQKEAEKAEEIAEIKTFQIKQGAQICQQDGKPVIRLFSTAWCPHCVWIKDTYETVIKEYQGRGLIVGYHWELDTDEVPDEEMAIYQEFNPRGSIPTFIFGCKYWRIGNGYEQEDDLASEQAEFRAIIESLINQSQ